MHVFERFNPLLLSEHIEVVERACLPESGLIAPCTEKSSLCFSLTQPPQHSPRQRLLEGFNHNRKISPVGFAQQQVDVFRHDDVADHLEFVLRARVLRNSEKQIAPARREQWQAAKAGEGDEVQVTVAVVALQVVRHGAKCTRGFFPESRPRQVELVLGHPSIASSSIHNRAEVIAGERFWSGR